MLSNPAAGLRTDQTKYCSGCAAPLHISAAQCPHCGASAGPARETKSRGLAIVLALLFGCLGIHKFYLGQMGWGLAYFLLCWTFIPALISIVEAIGYVAMGDRSFHAKYG